MKGICMLINVTIIKICFILLGSLCMGFGAYAAGVGAPTLNGADIHILWGLPFVGMLLSIAIFPIVASHFWHHHFSKIAMFWALAFIVPFVLSYGVSVSLYEILHVILLEYIPFIILLLSLFTVAGGICVKGGIKATPVINTSLLAFGTITASFTGTTGASMLLIRPLIRANKWRLHRTHVVIFFIFLVSNIGGSLTPLGDPPLFLGFLKGVSFFWPMLNLILPMLMVSFILLASFFIMDWFLMKKEKHITSDFEDDEKFAIVGVKNIMLLLLIVLVVLTSGLWKPNISFTIYYIDVELQNLMRDLLLLGITYVSWKTTPKENYHANGFTWFPIEEVAKLFIAIFITIIPVIAILKAGEQGALSHIIQLVTNEDGTPNNSMYFWVTGLLSGFLDNAPTYLVFFNVAGGDPVALTTSLNTTLLAISVGAVFMGALTYIGNAPNFMVRSIAEEQGIVMPSFFGYILWSMIFVIPCCLLVNFVFFV